MGKVSSEKLEILRAIAERNARLVVSCRQIADSDLTRTEQTAILPNAALVDRSNLRLILRPIVAGKSRVPLGATDLTNPINVAEGTVHVHPVVSLYEQIVAFLEDRKAPRALCMLGREVASQIDRNHRSTLDSLGIAQEWPDFRGQWEADMQRREILPKEYLRDPPAPGVSPEWLGLKVAKRSGFVPNIEDCSIETYQRHALAAGTPKDEAAAHARPLYETGKLRVQGQLQQWAVLNKEIVESFDVAVAKPYEEHGQAWMLTGKMLQSEWLEKAGSFSVQTREFAENLAPTEAMVLRQAVETAGIAVMAPSIDDKLTLGTLKITKWLADKAASKGIDKLQDLAIEKAEEAFVGSLGITGKLLYYAVKGAYTLAGKPGSEFIKEKLEETVKGITARARAHLGSDVLGSTLSEELQKKDQEHLASSPLEEIELKTLSQNLTPIGARTASLISAVYEQSRDPAVVRSFASCKTNLGTATFAEQLLPQIARDTANLDLPSEDGLSFKFQGSQREKNEVARMTTSTLILSQFPEAMEQSLPAWVKGANRISHSQIRFDRLCQLNIDRSEQKTTHSFNRGADSVKALSSTADNWVRRLDKSSLLLTDDAVSTIMSAVEDTYRELQVDPLPTRNKRGDWPAIVALNSGLASGMIAPGDLRHSLKAIPTELQPQSLAADLAIVGSKTILRPQVETLGL